MTLAGGIVSERDPVMSCKASCCRRQAKELKQQYSCRRFRRNARSARNSALMRVAAKLQVFLNLQSYPETSLSVLMSARFAAYLEEKRMFFVRSLAQLGLEVHSALPSLLS
jgi:hypothetical protein